MTAMTALLGFAAWTLALVIGVLLWRGIAILSGQPINGWARGAITNNDPAIATRLADAHANCIENLVVFAAIVLAGASLNKTAALSPFAAYVLYARIAQSVTHLIGTSRILVTIRATFWSIQLALFVVMFLKLLT